MVHTQLTSVECVWKYICSPYNVIPRSNFYQIQEYTYSVRQHPTLTDNFVYCFVHRSDRTFSRLNCNTFSISGPFIAYCVVYILLIVGVPYGDI